MCAACYHLFRSHEAMIALNRLQLGGDDGPGYILFELRKLLGHIRRALLEETSEDVSVLHPLFEN